MKPAPFAYEKPGSLEELFSLLGEYGEGAAILAGGQSLMATLNMRLSTPDVLIDINGLDQLGGISVGDNKLRIGALARHYQVAESSDVKTHSPMIHMAMPQVAHDAIRNRGTFGGSIALADPAAEIPACVLCLDGEVEITGAKGIRRVSAANYFKGLYETDLQQGEIVTAVEVPVLKDGERHGFQELSRRHGDYAMVGLALRATVEETALSGVRLSFFGIGATPVLTVSAGMALEGELSDDTIANAQARLEDELDPFDDVSCSGATKLHLAKVLLERVVRQLVNEKEGEYNV